MWPNGHFFTWPFGHLANGHAAILGKKGHTALQRKKKGEVWGAHAPHLKEKERRQSSYRERERKKKEKKRESFL